MLSFVAQPYHTIAFAILFLVLPWIATTLYVWRQDGEVSYGKVFFSVLGWNTILGLTWFVVSSLYPSSEKFGWSPNDFHLLMTVCLLGILLCLVYTWSVNFRRKKID